MPQAPATPKLKTVYDYIVIGSGSGGAPVARRLVDAGADVLLIEAGGAGYGLPEIDDPTLWVPLGRSRHDWGHNYTPSPHVDGRTIPIPRGRLLGGSSAINAMMWYRGHPDDYDGWDEAGARGWRFADVLPFFRACEDWQGGENDFRGAGGPLRIEISPDPHPLATALIEGMVELGVPRIDDPNGPDNEGVALSNFNISAGRRWCSARGYLEPVRIRSKLTILTNSLVIRLGLEAGRCVSVRHVVDGQVVETRASGEIVLAAGAIETPRLLMLSGIGDPAELARLGIATRVGLLGVGRNLQDHPLVRAINFRSKRPLGPARDNGGGSMANWKTEPGLSQANVHAFPVQGRSATAEIAASHDLTGNVFAVGVGLMRSRSRGYLRLHDAEPGGRLEIQPNFLAEPADLDDLVEAVDRVMALAGTHAYADWFAGHAAPARTLSRPETIAFIRTACSTFFHPCGTAKMGEDETSVVDSELKVHGVEGLRIADASVIPRIPACNTHAPVTMIGERAAAFLLGTARVLHGQQPMGHNRTGAT